MGERETERRIGTDVQQPDKGDEEVVKRFRDLDQVRQDLESAMSLDEFIEIVDNKPLERVSETLYKKRCDLDEHPCDPDGTRDSTPSFTVCPQKELWHCFGCGTSGDRFEYLSRKLHMDHIEAIHKAAEIMGIDLSPYYEEQSSEDMVRDSLFRENAQAREIAHNTLLSDEKALNYILGRGISMESIDEFMIGYAPPMSGDRVTEFDAVPNSITLQLDRKDQFNDAILFPVCDPYGRMRYFQSRPFHPYAPGMKYIGGRDTHPLYDDNDRMFGLSVARKKLKQTGGRLVGVEGAPDAIVCNQHGIASIGFLGTTVNQNTMDTLGRYRVTELVMLLDGDKAGRDRSVQIANKYLSMQTTVRLKLALMPDGDPDEYINAHGADALVEIIDNAPLAIEHLINMEFDDINPDTPTKRIEFLCAMEKYVAGIHDNMTRKIIMRYIAEKIDFDPIEVEDYYMRSTAVQGTVQLFVPDEEEVLLAEAIRNPEFCADLMSRYRTTDWYLTRHQRLFDILRTAKYTDVDSLYQMAKNMGIDNLVSYQWLASLVHKTGNIEFCLGDVEDKLIRRRVTDISTRMQSEMMDLTADPNIIVDQTINDIFNVVTKQADNNIFTGEQQVNDVMKLIHERMKDPGKIIGWDLGPRFKKLTKALLGLQTKTLTVVAANQSVGKTQLGENFAMELAVNQGVGTLWFTLEMDKDRMTFRNLSMLSGVPLTPLLTGNITVDDKIQKVDPWAVKLAGAPFYLSERGHDLVEALAIARRYVMKGVKVIFVDYIQLQHVSTLFGKKRYEELGVISKAWKQFAKEMDVAVVAISQLSKEALKDDIAKAEHGAGSYEVAQDSDNYITLKEKDEEEIQQRGIEKGNITMNLDKNRMGTADILVDIYSDRATQQMQEVNTI